MRASRWLGLHRAGWTRKRPHERTSPSSSAIPQSIDSSCTSIPTKALLNFLMVCLLYSVDTVVFNVWLCVIRHAIHDIEEAGLPLTSGNNSV